MDIRKAQVSNTCDTGDAQTLVENCGNTVVLHCSGELARRDLTLGLESHRRARDRARGIHLREQSRFIPPPTDTTPSSESVTFRHVQEAAVLASEIEQLSDLEGFLKLVWRPSWTQVVLTQSKKQ